MLWWNINLVCSYNISLSANIFGLGMVRDRSWASKDEINCGAFPLWTFLNCSNIHWGSEFTVYVLTFTTSFTNLLELNPWKDRLETSHTIPKNTHNLKEYTMVKFISNWNGATRRRCDILKSAARICAVEGVVAVVSSLALNPVLHLTWEGHKA